MKVREALHRIAKDLVDDKNTRNLGLLLKKSLEITPRDYIKLNKESRMSARECTLDSLTKALEKNATEELNDRSRHSLENLPKIEQPAEDIDGESEESKLIGAFEDVHIEEGYVKYDDPGDPLSTLVKMSFSDRILYNYLKVQYGLRDWQDYERISRLLFSPLHRVLRKCLGEQYKDKLYLYLFKLSRLYGMPPVKKLKPTDVYTGAYSFYKGHEGESTITFSTSSGLPNPLERYGTDEFADRYSIPDSDIGDLLLKNPYRMDSFAKAILNRDIDCRRVYVWEKDGTSKALKTAAAKVPREKRQQFLDEAADLLAEGFLLEQIRIIEINEFDEWMRRFTRNAKGEVMLSMRGTDSKRISEAIQVSFDLPAMEGAQKEFGVASTILGAILHITQHPAGKAVGALVLGQGIFYSLVKSTLRRALDFESQLMEVGRLVKDYGALEQGKARNEAEKTIEELLG